MLALVFMQFSAQATTSVTLAWNQSQDPAIAGYNIYYGGSSRYYTNRISVGNATNATIPGLIQGITYYFAATTYSASGIESPFSSELAYLVPMGTSAANQPPTLNPINDVTISQRSGIQIVSLSDITSGSTTENQTLTVSAVSSDSNLIPDPTVNYTSANTTGSLSFAPNPNANGTVIITVTVNDGQTRNNTMVRTFTVTVVADSAQNVLINPFTNQVAMAGQTCTFSTTVGKLGHFTYNWRFNGLALTSTPSPTLVLSNVTTNQAGIYSLTVSDGHVFTSCAATLTVYGTAAGRLAPASHAGGQYALAVAGVPGYKYVVQGSTNLISWVSLQTNTAPFTFVDANAGKFRQRFYRSVYVP